MEKEIKNNLWDGSDVNVTRVYNWYKTFYVDVIFKQGNLIELIHKASGIELMSLCGIGVDFANLKFVPHFFIQFEVKDGEIVKQGSYEGGFCGWNQLMVSFDGETLSPKSISYVSVENLIPFSLLDEHISKDDIKDGINKWIDFAVADK